MNGNWNENNLSSTSYRVQQQTPEDEHYNKTYNNDENNRFHSGRIQYSLIKKKFALLSVDIYNISLLKTFFLGK